MVKMLLIGDVDPGWVNTVQLRIKELQKLGMQIETIDVRSYLEGSMKWQGVLSRKTLWGRPLWSLNRDILTRAEECEPQVVWIEKGRYVFPQTLTALQSISNPTLVHHTADAAFHFHGNISRHFRRAVPIYDLMVTTKSYEVEHYQQLGCRNLLLQYPTFDEQLHRPIPLTAQEHHKYDSDVTFIGTYGPGDSRDFYLAPLEKLGINLRIWGQYWQAKCKHPYLRSRVQGDKVVGDDYVKAICAAKIGLGLLQKNVPDRNTTRTVEIPACGTFMLAERTDSHLEMFEEGKEAEFFDSQEEALDKVRYYLAHDRTREAIARAGRSRCLKSGYTNHAQLLQVVSEIKRLADSKSLAAA